MKILAFVLAGGEGARLYPLTAVHAKPALPFASGYRIIDFVLGNLVNAGVSSIYGSNHGSRRNVIDNPRLGHLTPVFKAERSVCCQQHAEV